VVWIQRNHDGSSAEIDVREANGLLHSINRKMVKKIEEPSVRERMEMKKEKKEKKLPRDFERLMNTPPEMLQPSMPLRDSTGGIQHGGDHYKRFPIQPVDYGEENKLTPSEYSVTKYVTRHRFHSGMKDLRKAFHFLQMLARRYYGVEVTITYSDQPKTT
jgi:hypothetical protein